MALRGSNDRGIPLQPMNVEQIVEKALAYDYNPTIPLKYWFRTASTLLKEVHTSSLTALPSLTIVE